MVDIGKRLQRIKLYQILDKFREGEMSDLLRSEIPDIDFCIEQVIPEMGIVCIYGPLEQFKSTLCLYFALCLATGKDTFIFKTKKRCHVLWIDEEMGVVGLKNKVSKLCKGLKIDPKELEGYFRYESIKGFKLDDDKSNEHLKSIIMGQDTDVVFIDSISRVMTGDENKVQDVNRLHINMRNLCEDCAITFVTIHHTKKSNGKQIKRIESLRGSSDFGNQVDFAFSLESFEQGKYIFRQEKSRYGLKMPSINFSVISDIETLDTFIALTYSGLASENKELAIKSLIYTIKTDILELLRENPTLD